MSRAAMLPVPSEIGEVRLAPFKTAWLWLNGLGASAAVAAGLPSPALLCALVALTLATLCLGHSVGLHRGLIHRTYAMGRGLERVLLALFVLTGLGGPLSWIRLHRVRDYWQNREDCPPYFAYRHGTLRDAWWSLHCRFLPRGTGRYRFDQSLERDRLLCFLELTWPLWQAAFFLALLLAAGWQAALLLGPFRNLGSLLGHWWIGYRSHLGGERPFEIDGAAEPGSNHLLLGWVSFGEGFHANHHAMPDSARIGVRVREIDLGWWALLLLERLGLVTGLRSWSRGNAGLKAGTRPTTPLSESRRQPAGAARSPATVIAR